jgi:hypothetical protein
MEKFGIEPLDVDNYASWSVRMEAVNKELGHAILAPPHNQAVGPQPEHAVSAVLWKTAKSEAWPDRTWSSINTPTRAGYADNPMPAEHDRNLCSDTALVRLPAIMHSVRRYSYLTSRRATRSRAKWCSTSMCLER